MTAICVIHSCHHPKHVLPPTTDPMTTRVAAGSPMPLSITCSSTNDLDEAASSQGKDGAHVCVGVDDTNGLFSTGEVKMSKPIYSENNFYTNKAKEKQYRFSHRELFYTSLQTYFKTFSTFSSGLLKGLSSKPCLLFQALEYISLVPFPLACQHMNSCSSSINSTTSQRLG